VYSLFNTSSQQSSLRGIAYKGKKWDILNQFFFMDCDEIKTLANKTMFQALYEDAKAFGADRHVNALLKQTALSPDAKEVLEAAKTLVAKSMDMRKTWHEEHPEHHLNAWDAGWAQMKPMLKEAFKDEYKKFTDLYKKFEDRMRKGVYEFGFLKA